MINILRKITEQKPLIYGLSYLGLIPLFAIIFYVSPSDYLDLGKHDNCFSSYFYFSVVTITTLGYGDILPIGTVSKILTSLESVLGITLIGLFLNALAHKQGVKIQKAEKLIQQHSEKETDIKRFVAFNSLVEMHIKRYLIYTLPVTCKITDRAGKEINKKFTFNDMADLFKPTLRLTDHHFTPAVNYYFEEYKEFYNVIEEAVKHGYLHRWGELEALCLDYLNESKELDFSNYIVNQPNTRLGEKTGAEFDVEMIEKHQGEVKYLQGNGINPYIAMYHQIKLSFNFIESYQKLTVQVKNG